MGWNGSGNFSRLFSWVADKAAGLDISSSRMDADTNDIAANGFGNCLTRDGQGQPTTNLPMASFRHTGVGNGVARSDYAAMQQAQDGLLGWTIATGSADAITATYTPSAAAFSDGMLRSFRATAANATTTPTFAPDGLTPHTITKIGGTALAVADIPGNFAEVLLRYNVANTRWELLNPSNQSINNGVATSGDVKFTIKITPDPGWLTFDDGTFGSATSGSSNSNSAANQTLFTLMFVLISDTYAPLFTSTGSPTTRAGQGTPAAAWAANCRMSLPKTLGRALAVAGSGSGLTARVNGQTVGNETATLGTGNLPAYTPAGTVTVTPVNGTNGIPSTTFSGGGTADYTGTGAHALGNLFGGPSGVTFSSPFTGSPQGGASTPFSIMPPMTFLNAMIKQ